MDKTKKILKIITICLFCIIIKVWHLSIIKKEKTNIPQFKTILYPSSRGMIYDRHKNPLAINKTCYQVSIYYSHIRKLPTCIWKNVNGKKEKYFFRKNYINSLSKLLAKELNLDEERIEDLIHSKASLMPHMPFVIKDDISEKTYYKLKMLEKDWTGLNVRISQKRFYPEKNTASQVLGYLGAINRKEYLKIAEEIKTLKKNINKNSSFDKNQKIKSRLSYLKKKSYSINDFIGKIGIEKNFEEILRGCHGKKKYAIDIKGNFLKKIKTKPKKSGKSIITSLSLPIQILAEKLLKEDENIRKTKKKEPFIKGGSIVAMDPNNGEILALASFPTFNPNDFIKKNKNIEKWLEVNKYISDIYDGKRMLQKEIFNKKYQKKITRLTMGYFLDSIASEEIKKAFQDIYNIKNAVLIQEKIDTLIYFSNNKNIYEIINYLFPSKYGHVEAKINNYPFLKIEEKNPFQKELSEKELSKKELSLIKKELSSFLNNIKNNKDKILTIDLCRLFIDSNLFSDELLKKVGNKSLEFYWNISKKYLKAEEEIKNLIYPIFCKKIFKKWQIEYQKEYLIQKRQEEKIKGTFFKPYIDHLDHIKNILFNDFFKKHKLILIASLIKEENLADESLKDFFIPLKNLNFPFLKKNLKNLDFNTTYSFLRTIKPVSSLNKKLLGKYNIKGNSLKDLALSFYPKHGFGYCKSLAYQEAAPLGSIFKIVTSYAALKNKYENLSKKNIFPKRINPFTMIDIYKWDPKVKNSKGIVVGYHLNGKPFPKYYKKGRLIPSKNKNIGQIDITNALARSSNPYFSILAGDYIKSAKDLILASKNLNIGKKTNIDLPGEIKGNLPNDISYNKTSLYSFAIGQHSLITTPLQIATMFSCIANKGTIYKPQILKSKKEILKTVKMPESIRNTILEGLHKALWSEKGTAKAQKIRKLINNPDLLEKYKKLKYHFVGKTSTAEIMYKKDISSEKAKKHNHVWFAGISFKDTKWEKPELVVVVYLLFGTSGKEAAPLAAQIIHKYREINN